MMNFDGDRRWKLLILFTYFSLGAFALISQTMLLREFFVVVYGNEFIFGVLLTNWLVGIFFGAMAGASVAERSNNNLFLFVISILVMCILLPLAITATRLLYAVSGTEAGTYISFLNVFIYSALFIIPISFFIGFVFPIAAKAQIQLANTAGNVSVETGKDRKVKGISDIYIFEALGSLFSGIVYTFFLAGEYNSYLIGALTILPLLLCGCIILWKLKRYVTLSVGGLLLLIAAVLTVPPVNKEVERITVKSRWRSVSILPLTYSTDTRYQNVAIAETFGQYNLYLNTMFASVFPNDEDNRLLAAHLMCQHKKPKRILVIGDAVSGLAKHILRYDVEKVISVEIDPVAVQTILRFLPEQDKKILKDKRFEIVIRDGRKYVKDMVHTDGHTRPAFDMVFLNIPEPSTLLINRYYTREFFSDLSGVLGRDGVIALRVTSSESYTEGVVSNYTASIYHTVKSVFRQVVVTPGTENFIFASNGTSSVSDNPKTLVARYEASGVEPKKLGMIFDSLYPKNNTRFIKNALENRKAGTVRINTDETPIACLYFNKVIGWYGESNLAAFLGIFEDVDLTFLAMIVLGFFLLRMGYLWLNKKPHANRKLLRFHTLLSVFSAGMAGLALELVILYTFQNHFGNIYYIIGFIIAVFMFGLPLGAASANGLVRRIETRGTGDRDTRITRLIILAQILMGLASLTLPYLMNLFSKTIIIHQVIIFAETICIGITVGFLFPLSIHIYMDKTEETGKTAGIVDAFDHIGAAVGAFFVGTLFLPVIGVEKVCWLIAIFPFISAFLLFTDINRLKQPMSRNV